MSNRETSVTVMIVPAKGGIKGRSYLVKIRDEQFLFDSWEALHFASQLIDAVSHQHADGRYGPHEEGSR